MGDSYWAPTQNAGEIVFDIRSYRADTEAARKYIGLPGTTDASTQQQVNANMLGVSVLDAERYPTAVFKIQSAKLLSQASNRGLPLYQLTGELTLHGVAKKLTVAADAEEKNGWTHLRGNFSINQTDFGIKPFTKAFGAVGIADKLTIHGDLWVAGTVSVSDGARSTLTNRRESFIARIAFTYRGAIPQRHPQSTIRTTTHAAIHMISCPTVEKHVIQKHYDVSTLFYRLLWGPHIHHGLWYGNEGIRQAQLQLTDSLARLAKVSPGERVLDVGCGMGGSSIHLAKRYGCSVTGITLSPLQRHWAAMSSRWHRVNRAAQFHCADAEDFQATAQSLDVIWSIECTEHLFDKAAFF